MRARNKRKAFLNFVLYILNLNVNFLIKKRMYQKNLKENFDENNLFIHDKFNK